MRKLIAALQMSVDGFIEGPNGEVDWIGAWEDSFDLLPQVDTCILGGRMYPGYEQYWLAILADLKGVLPLTGMVASEGEIAYAQSPIGRPTWCCPRRWTRSPGTRHGSFGMWERSGA
jgi:hypothetical protein